MTPRPLTRRQAEVLEYLIATLVDRQRLPTIREVSAHLGAASANAGQEHLRALEERGYLTRESRHPEHDVIRITRDPRGRPIHLDFVLEDDPPTTRSTP